MAASTLSHTLCSEAEAFYASPLLFEENEKMAVPAGSVVALSLADPLTNEVYKIVVDPDDAKRAGKDLVFATQLFQQAKLKAAAAAKQAANARAPVAPEAATVAPIVATMNGSTTTLGHCLHAGEAGSSALESPAQTIKYSDGKEDEATSKRKRGRDSLTEQLIDEKRKYREAKQRQHDEKIREARRLSDILEKLVLQKRLQNFTNLRLIPMKMIPRINSKNL